MDAKRKCSLIFFWHPNFGRFEIYITCHKKTGILPITQMPVFLLIKLAAGYLAFLFLIHKFNGCPIGNYLSSPLHDCRRSIADINYRIRAKLLRIFYHTFGG